MGSLGQQSQSQILQAHAGGTETTPERSSGMGTGNRDPRALLVTGREVLMRELRAWCLRFTGLFQKERRDHELAEELESHLQMHIEDNLRSGMKLEEARRQALVKLGGIEQAKEQYREQRGIPALETALQD